MELIKYDSNGGLLTIEVTINGTPTWQYSYAEDQLHENDSTTGRPKSHTLGMPPELIKKTHVWEFRLGNVANGPMSVEIRIEWFQEAGPSRTKTRIHGWIKACEINANSGRLEGDSALLVA